MLFLQRMLGKAVIDLKGDVRDNQAHHSEMGVFIWQQFAELSACGTAI